MGLSLNNAVDVIVYVSPLAAPRRAFDTGLIVGPSTIIPIADRLRLYNDMDAVISDGFASDSVEYVAAQLYFSQKPRPTKLMIGRRFKNGIQTFSVAAGGTGYAIGDFLKPAGAGTGASFRVTAIGVNGAVTTVALIEGGGDYATDVGLSTTVTPAGGTGCTISILTVEDETAVEAVTGCRLKNNEWYGVSYLGATEQDIKDLAAYVETATPTTTLFATVASAAIKHGIADNVADYLKGKKYSRTHLLFSTTSPHAVVGIMGYAMRNNTGLANSCYTLKFKQIVGVTVDDVSATEAMNIEGYNCNVYLNRGYYYDMYEQGVMSNGQFFDEVLNLDMLTNRIQLNIMDKLYQAPKVPQTEAGVTQLVDACNSACNRSVIQGFLAPGKWTGQPLMNLNTGDFLPLGYLVQSEAINDQDQADREARKAPPIYVAIKEAGAIHSVTIGVYVNR